MKSFPRSIRYAWAALWYACVGLIVLAAVSLTIARVLLTDAGQYKDQVEAWVSNFVGQPVAIAKLDADWHGLEPRLVLEDFQLLSRDSKSTFVRFQKARIGINLFASLRSKSLVPGSLTVEGAQLKVVRDSKGRLSVAGLHPATKTPADGNLLTNWLLKQKLIDIKKSTVAWRDLKNGDKSWTFNDVNLRLRNADDRHQLDGSVNLPLEIGHQLEFAMDLNGDVLSQTGWSGNIYVNALGVQPTQWMKDIRFGGADITNGMLGGQIWSDWRDGQLTRASGNITVDELQLHAPNSRRLVAIDALGGRFDLQHKDGQWHLAADRVAFKRNKLAWPRNQLKLSYRPATAEQTARIAGSINYVRIEDIANLLSLSGTLKGKPAEALRTLQPRGELHDLKFSYEDGKQPEYAVEARVKNLASYAWQKLPGVHALDAKLNMTQNGGELHLKGENTRLDLPHVFRETLVAKDLSGAFSWQRQGAGWHVEANNVNVANSEAAAVARMALDLPGGDEKPFIDLAVHFKRGDMAQKSRYLPAGIMHPHLVDWLDRAVVDGNLTGGGLLYYGRVGDFPFRQGQGRFELSLDVADGVLDYVPGWPRIHGISGELMTDGRSLRFDASKGHIYDSNLENTHVEIADLSHKPGILTVNGQVAGPAADGLRFLHEAPPLEKAFARGLTPFQASGDTRLDLALTIPLEPKAYVGVKGAAHFAGNGLAAESYALDISAIHGDLAFTETGISAQGLQGRLSDMPVRVDIDTTDDDTRRALHIRGRGTAGVSDVRRVFAAYLDKPHWAGYLDGTADWNGELVIPHKKPEEKTAPPVTLHIKSDLAGMSVSLPEPLAKTAAAGRLAIDADLTGNPRRVRLGYGNHNAVFEIATAGKKSRIERAGVGLHGEGVLPTEHGIRFSGTVDAFSWTAWQKILFPPPGTPALFSEEGPGVSQFYDVTISDLETFGRHFENVSLQASNSAQGWTLHTDSRDVAGTWFIPTYLSSSPLVMDMDRLFIKSMASTTDAAPLDPRDLPAFKITAKDFRVDDLKFGSIKLTATRIPEGMRLNELLMDTGHTHINANGDWAVTADNTQTSRFKVDVDSKNLGKSLKDWGYAGTIEKGKTNIGIDAAWPGSPIAFDLKNLNGTFNLKVDNGRLLDIEPGAARLFGLLSLQALPRRLTLDFSDMFSKGFSFDRIQGKFAIENGVATTDGLTMEGPSARIETVGKIGLATRDYDQVVTVTPRLGESLPLLGVALATPQVGATILLMQKLFEKQLNAISSVQYTVTGGWRDPVIKKVRKESAKSDDTLE